MEQESWPPKRLGPNLDLLREEFVLVQAWKKSAAYIRARNWFSDPLELDQAAVGIQEFLSDIRHQLEAPEEWTTDPLRLVPAPKSQDWWVRVEEGKEVWRPRFPDGDSCSEKEAANKGPAFNLRPLAHVSLRDQVVATALLLCLADRVETEQKDPATALDEPHRRDVTSYGHRLLCASSPSRLQHRWGSVNLYRSYFTDYRTFVKRSSVVAEQCSRQEVGTKTFIIHCDLSRFYDRVRPEFLARSLARMRRPGDDERFFDFATRALSWSWCRSDREEADAYARIAEINGYSRIALPQGLASAGFWANVALLELDEKMRESYSDSLDGLCVYDVCRYVDDIRIVATSNGDATTVKCKARKWLTQLLANVDPSHELRCNDEKMEVIEYGGAEKATVRRSQRMNRIQTRVSGGFTAWEGTEVLESIESLLNLRRGFTRREDESKWAYAPKPDVPEPTAARFGAARFRTVVRDVRPLLPEAGFLEPDERTGLGTRPRTRQELDESTKAFALGLVEMWVHDPSNVRVLLSGLDLWPDPDLLDGVLRLLREWTQEQVKDDAAARVAWYCLAEILRAGATRTGLAYRSDSLPPEINLGQYRDLLAQEAMAILAQEAKGLPWYLRQQAMLLLIGYRPDDAEFSHAMTEGLPTHYAEIAQVLRRRSRTLPANDFAKYAITLDRCFPHSDTKKLIESQLTRRRLEAMAAHDPSLASEILRGPERPRADGLVPLARRLLVDHSRFATGSLATLVMTGKLSRDEPTMLRLASELLKQLEVADFQGALPPWQVVVEGDPNQADGPGPRSSIRRVTVRNSSRYRTLPHFDPPDWSCDSNVHWRFQVGYLLRFAMTGSIDHTSNTRRSGERATSSFYRSATSHWLQRKYGNFNGLSAFGGDWLPVTDWFEWFLSALLRWPGRIEDHHSRIVDQGIPATRRHVEQRLEDLEKDVGSASNTQFLSMTASAKLIDYEPSLRVCVAQSVLPRQDDLKAGDDLTLDLPTYRARHRNHLTQVLAHVREALRLRETHRDEECARLDWLILPELAVHPDDLKSCLVPFARAFKTIVLAGVTYEDLAEAGGLVNTAVWLIPEQSPTGWHFWQRRQGKQHLMAGQRRLAENVRPIMPYRPCQWVITLPSILEPEGGLRLSASVCFDATDLSIAADLRDRADVYAVPALNQDVKTFDNLAVALNYHMFQMVIVANNGEFGGSSVYVPHGKDYKRRVLHLHGGEQATVAFFEIPNVTQYLDERDASQPDEVKQRLVEERKAAWKAPPAGYRGRRGR